MYSKDTLQAQLDNKTRINHLIHIHNNMVNNLNKVISEDMEGTNSQEDINNQEDTNSQEDTHLMVAILTRVTSEEAVLSSLSSQAKTIQDKDKEVILKTKETEDREVILLTKDREGIQTTIKAEDTNIPISKLYRDVCVIQPFENISRK